jgi:hypothetical protein
MPIRPKGEKRPPDVIGGAVKVIRIATGEEPDDRGNGRSQAHARRRETPPDRASSPEQLVFGPSCRASFEVQHDPTILPMGRRYAVLDFPNISIPTKTLATNISGEVSLADNL